MAYAGLRPEEALALRWADVGATLHVHRAYTHGELKDTKTGRARGVTVIGPLADDLAAWPERTGWADPGDLVCPSLGRADRPKDAALQGGFLHLTNWRSRAFRAASERAGLSGIIPYNGRDTFASLLIYEGRPPTLVAAALGHGDTQTLWRHYAGIFAEAEVGVRVPIEEAVREAREAVRWERNVPTSFPRHPSGGLREAPRGLRNRSQQVKRECARQDSNLRLLAPEASHFARLLVTRGKPFARLADLDAPLHASEIYHGGHHIPGLVSYGWYGPLIDRLRRETRSQVVEFPYDWRQTNALSAAALADRVDALKREHGDRQVVLIAHSMGGLVARHHIAQGGGHRHVRRLITLGTPYRGAAGAADALANGLPPTFGLLRRRLRSFLRTCPSVHELLPCSTASTSDPIDGAPLPIPCPPVSLPPSWATQRASTPRSNEKRSGSRGSTPSPSSVTGSKPTPTSARPMTVSSSTRRAGMATEQFSSAPRGRPNGVSAVKA